MVLQAVIAFCAYLGIFIHYLTAPDLPAFLRLFNYYTLQTNLIVAVVITIRLILKHQKKPSRFMDWLFGASTLWILITGVIYHLLLGDLHHPEGLDQVSNLLTHSIVPFGMTLYYVFFDREGAFSWRIPITYCSYPVLYAGVSLIRGRVDGFYPYWFLNPYASYPEGIGTRTSLVIFLGIVVLVFILLGYLLNGLRHFRLRRLNL